MDNARELRGKMIAALPSQIRHVDSAGVRGWVVKSQSGNGEYLVQHGLSGWTCKCPDHVHRLVECKHIWAVRLSFAIRQEVQRHVIEPITEIHACLYCKSDHLIRFGLRHNKFGDLQKFACKACGKFFTVNVGFEKMKHNRQGITTAMQLYFSGESLRNTTKALKLIGVQVSHQTVYNWITKYVGLMDKYLDKITPQVSDTWRADEMSLKVKGNLKWLFALMDDETRFWIAQQVSDSKYTADITPMLRQGKDVTGKAPTTLITDGAPNFNAAFRKVFWRERKALAIRHEQHVRLQSDLNNQKMERMNGEIRDPEKVVRGLKMENSPLIKGLQIYHNYVRTHEGLNNRTPAEVAGIRVEGQDKWLTIIQNAAKKQQKVSERQS